MKMVLMGLERYAFSVCAATLMLAGCGVSQPPIPAGWELQSSAMAAQTSRGARMLPNVKSADLLYVADSAANKVDVLTYPQGALVGSFHTGVATPGGECVDSVGNVYVTNSSDSNILIFYHGSLDPPNTISDPGYYPSDCSFDVPTGTLAVVSGLTSHSGPGSVAIYPNHSYIGKIYKIRGLSLYTYCGYDNKGNLFVDGFDTGSKVQLAELAKGASRFSRITIDKSVISAGPIKWDGKYLAFGDSSTNSIYRLRIRGSRATIVGSTTFKKNAGPIRAFWIVPGSKGDTLIAGANSGGTRYLSVKYWAYPKGSSIKQIHGFVFPYGVAVSLAHH
jgi:hypothetical protein